MLSVPVDHGITTLAERSHDGRNRMDVLGMVGMTAAWVLLFAAPVVLVLALVDVRIPRELAHEARTSADQASGVGTAPATAGTAGGTTCPAC